MTYCGSGASCQSNDECAGVSLKWIATTSVRSFSATVPSSTCEALSGPVNSLNACSMISLVGLEHFSKALRRHPLARRTRCHPPLEGEGRPPKQAKRSEGGRGGVTAKPKSRFQDSPHPGSLVSASLRRTRRPSPSRGGWHRVRGAIGASLPDSLPKPARLQPRELAVVAQRLHCAVDGVAQAGIVHGESDAELFMRGHVERDREARAIFTSHASTG